MKTSEPNVNDITKLVHHVRSADASFYRALWVRTDDTESLPVVSRADFIRTPLKDRLYKDARMYAKYVTEGDVGFTSAWAFEDIVKEPYGVTSYRPMVYMQSAHEAIEKGIWCYGNGMVPLVAEHDPRLAAFSARRYKIDSLIVDTATHVETVTSILETVTLPLKSISIIGAHFDIPSFLMLKSYAENVRLVLAREETGVMAEAVLDENPLFIAVPDAVIHIEETIVITRKTLLCTPIIRYKTSIQARFEEFGNAQGSFRLN